MDCPPVPFGILNFLLLSLLLLSVSKLPTSAVRYFNFSFAFLVVALYLIWSVKALQTSVTVIDIHHFTNWQGFFCLVEDGQVVPDTEYQVDIFQFSKEYFLSCDVILSAKLECFWKKIFVNWTDFILFDTVPLQGVWDRLRWGRGKDIASFNQSIKYHIYVTMKYFTHKSKK